MRKKGWIQFVVVTPRTPPEASALLHSLGAGRIRTVVLVRVPSALSMFFTSLRIGVTHAMTGAIFVEYVGAKQWRGI